MGVGVKVWMGRTLWRNKKFKPIKFVQSRTLVAVKGETLHIIYPVHRTVESENFDGGSKYTKNRKGAESVNVVNL